MLLVKLELTLILKESVSLVSRTAENAIQVIDAKYVLLVSRSRNRFLDHKYFRFVILYVVMEERMALKNVMMAIEEIMMVAVVTVK